MTSFLRALSDAVAEGGEQDGPGGPTTTTTSMDPKVFWPVNGFILLLITIACCTCYWYGGLPWWRIDNAETMRRNSDEAYRARVARRLEEEAERRRGSPEKRQKALIRSFKRCKVHMVVQETDLVDSKGEQPAALLGSTEEESDSGEPESGENGAEENDESSPKVVVEIPAEMTETSPQEEGQLPFEEDLGSESSDEEDDYDPEELAEVDLEAANETIPVLPSYDDDETAANGYLILRGSDFPVRRRVPNCCAICLGCYEVGEQVVWSSNEKCAHAFHMTCLVDWLTKMRDGTPCPCCRAEFTDLEKHRRERRITWRPDNAFNPNVFTL